MKEKVTREFFDKHFSPGFCRVCEHFNEEYEECEIEDVYKFNENEAFDNGYDKEYSNKMECVMWEYKYTTE